MPRQKNTRPIGKLLDEACKDSDFALTIEGHLSDLECIENYLHDNKGLTEKQMLINLPPLLSLLKSALANIPRSGKKDKNSN